MPNAFIAALIGSEEKKVSGVGAREKTILVIETTPNTCYTA
jgi:hypothetical protein